MFNTQLAPLVYPQRASQSLGMEKITWIKAKKLSNREFKDDEETTSTIIHKAANVAVTASEKRMSQKDLCSTIIFNPDTVIHMIEFNLRPFIEPLFYLFINQR